MSDDFLKSGFSPKFIFLFSSSLNLGLNIWVTYVAGTVMRKTVDRHTFLKVQGRLFPVYFAMTGATSFLQLLSIYWCKPYFSGLSTPELSATYASSLALATTVFNGVWLAPKLSKVYSQRSKLEVEAGVMYPNISSKLKNDSNYKTLLQLGRRYHTSSVILSLCGTAVSFYMIYLVATIMQK